jgi:sugar O-acyltransferase (sialic acid O-acetyltransferase NeuD family)
MIWGGLPIVIIGTSGISKEVKTIIDEINKLNYVNQFDFLGFISEKEENVGEMLIGERIIASDSQLDEFFSQYKQIGVIIPIGTPQIKRKIFNQLKKYNNIVYPNIVSPSAKIMDMKNINLGIGNIICSGCVLTTEISIGNFNLVNINSTIGHDTNIGDYCVINPLSSISGNVKIFDGVLCGAGCAIKQGITIGNNSIIGLGAFIVKDVKENSIMICNPAKNMVKE